jgi:hypothetical protein
MHVVGYILLALLVGLHLAVAVVLLLKFLRTRDSGYIWLGVAVVLWPGLSAPLNSKASALISRAGTGQASTPLPFSLVQHGVITMGDLYMLLSVSEGVVGVCLLLIAVLSLGKANGSVKPTAST